MQKLSEQGLVNSCVMNDPKWQKWLNYGGGLDQKPCSRCMPILSLNPLDGAITTRPWQASRVGIIEAWGLGSQLGLLFW